MGMRRIHGPCRRAVSVGWLVLGIRRPDARAGLFPLPGSGNHVNVLETQDVLRVLMAVPNRLCPSCRASLPIEAAFCLMCGTRVDRSPAPTATDPLRAALDAAVGTQYEIMRLLGRGGMGAVYLAREPALDRLVAIKVLPPTNRDDPTRERFRREARTAAKLTHPHVVPLHTFGEANDMMYFVMGFVQGESLGDLMRRKGTIPPDDARRVLAEIADALDYAHRQGVVHRDVKPDNILIEDDSGKALLTDFGIAKAAASGSTLTEAGSVVGTVHYMSPEQASGEKDVDGRSDLYSLGVIGYAMLAGRLPFDSESAQEILVQHITKEAIPLHTLIPEVQGALAGAVTRCLMKDRSERWPDARRLHDALQASVDHAESLPEELAAVVGFGSSAAGLAAAAFGVGFVALLAGDKTPLWVWVPALFGLVMLVAIPASAADVRRGGFTWKQVFGVMFRQPKQWPFWWPHRLRGPGDVWDRLPSAVRRARRDGLLWLGYLVPFVSAAVILKARGVSGLVRGVILGVFGLGVVTLPFIVNRYERWVRSVGLSKKDASKLMDEVTFDSQFWRRPKIAALLTPARQSHPPSGVQQPTTAREYVDAIKRIGRQLPHNVQDIGSESVAAAEQLIASVEAAEKEIEKLAIDADTSEIARLEGRLTDLTEQHGLVNDDDRRMRELIQHQLDLMRRLAGRLDATQERRARMLDLLKTLWLQVASLHAETAPTPPGSDEITGRIRALCEEIEGHVAATEETALLLTPPAES